MTKVERIGLKPGAVLWTKSRHDADGSVIVNDPVEIQVRFSDGLSDSLNNQGENEATSIDLLVDRELPLQSILWFGRLRQLTDSPTPLYQVIGNNKTPDLKGRHYLYTAKLILFTSTLPQLET